MYLIATAAVGHCWPGEVRIDVAGLLQARPFHVASHMRHQHREASAAIVVYDVTNPESLDSVVTWKKDIDEKVRPPRAVIGAVLTGAGQAERRQQHTVHSARQQGPLCVLYAVRDSCCSATLPSRA
jgi:hypothetical protein